MGLVAVSSAASDESRPSPIVFYLNPRSGTPTYLQLVEQVEEALRVGYLHLGDQLPRVKDVVSSLSINPNTVLKAYRELEHRGIAIGKPGVGTFVQAEPVILEMKVLARLRRRLAAGWLKEAIEAGLDEAGATALFATTARDVYLALHDGEGPARADATRANGGAA